METIDSLSLARQIVEDTDTSLFLTGKAGTGKTTFLHRLQATCPKHLVILAPTGIAAINAGGMTLHSFFQLPFSPFIPGTAPVNHTFRINEQKIKLIRNLELIIIDEISMVRADVLDAIDATLKRIRRDQRPFGGIQLLLIGDLQQLAPVVKDEEWDLLKNLYDSPYFFSSHALRQMDYATVELEKVHRQNDERFIRLLNNLRTSSDLDSTIKELNQRCYHNTVQGVDDGCIHLVTHNHQAAQINEQELAELPGEAYTFHARIDGKFPEMSYPTSSALVLKKGAQVMFVKNDTQKRFFNGMIGKITSINAKGFSVTPSSDTSKSIEVSQETWENTRYALDKDTQSVIEQREGSFTQYPVRLAWAITIHKSQGLTFDKVRINASAAFAHGQAYVALSRCRTLEGIVLTSPIPQSAIIADRHIDLFQQEIKAHAVGESQLRQMRNQHTLNLITNLFSFERERIAFASVVRIFEESLYKAYPETLSALKEALHRFDTSIMSVARNFYNFYSRKWEDCDTTSVPEPLQERIRKGAHYFYEELEYSAACISSAEVETDSQAIKKKLKRAVEDWDTSFRTHSALLDYTSRNGFQLQAYQAERAKLLHTKPARNAPATNGTSAQSARLKSPLQEIHNQAAYEKLVAWRRAKMKAEGKAAYLVMQTSVLVQLANTLPQSDAELAVIKGLGTQRINAYGQELITLLQPFAEANVGTLTLSSSQESATESTKKEKVHTRIATLQLFQKGMRPQEIAETRGLKESTILQHLSSFFSTGEVSLTDLMEETRASSLAALCRQFDNSQEHVLTQIREKSGDAFSYEEIRMALAFIKAKSNDSAD